jgi:AraC family transcriptional regulator
MLTTIAEIATPSTKVEVLEGDWPQPVEHTWRDPRAVVTLLMRPSWYWVEGCYRDVGPDFSRIGEVFFIPPDFELVGRGRGGSVKAARCIFDPTFYERTLGTLPLLSGTQLRRSLDIRGTLMPALLARLMEEALSPGFAGAALAESLGAALLIEWARQALHSERSGEASRRGLTTGQRKIVTDYLAALDCAQPSVSALAVLCGLSERQFCKRFREEMGCTAGRYLAAAQMRRAQNLLLDSDLPLKEIAYRLGFANPANFSAAFRAATHQPPGAFRRRHRHAAGFVGGAERYGKFPRI